MIKHKCLGIIPARGGSKRIQGKNIKQLAGKPLIIYTIEAALNSNSLWKVTVTTDDNDIAEVSRAAGADVPFMRPGHLSSDRATSLDVVKHALDYYRDNGENPTEVVLLQPTSPLRNNTDIDRAIKLFRESGTDTLVSVRASSVKMATLVPGIALDDRLNLHEPPQKKGEMWQLNGAIYITKVDTIYEKDSLFGDSIIGYAMPAERSIDIDTEDDWRMTEILIRGGYD